MNKTFLSLILISILFINPLFPNDPIDTLLSKPFIFCVFGLGIATGYLLHVRQTKKKQKRKHRRNLKLTPRDRKGRIIDRFIEEAQNVEVRYKTSEDSDSEDSDSDEEIIPDVESLRVFQEDPTLLKYDYVVRIFRTLLEFKTKYLENVGGLLPEVKALDKRISTRQRLPLQQICWPEE